MKIFVRFCLLHHSFSQANSKQPQTKPSFWNSHSEAMTSRSYATNPQPQRSSKSDRSKNERRYYMKGKILDFQVQSSSGAISGEDGKRYNFQASEWKAGAKHRERQLLPMLQTEQENETQDNDKQQYFILRDSKTKA